MSRRRCILIEDSRTVTRLIFDCLGKRDYAVLSAESFEAAERGLAAERPEVVLLDLVLPGLSGAEGVRRARGLWPKAGLVAMTGGSGTHGVLPLLRDARAAGADLTLVKPFSEAQLQETADDGHRIGTGLGRRQHVMVVDDSRTVLSIARMALLEAGFRVTGCATMEEALERLPLQPYDCLVTDIFMPGMGGIEGIAQCRAAWPEIGVVAMSGGLSEQMDREKALSAARKLGAGAVLGKPFRGEALVMAVRQAVKQAALVAQSA